MFASMSATRNMVCVVCIKYMENVPPPENITPAKPIRYVMAHIDYKLEVLHRQCERMGLSEAAEAALRADLEEERVLLGSLPPESPYLEALALQELHEARASARSDIMMGESADLSQLRSADLEG